MQTDDHGKEEKSKAQLEELKHILNIPTKGVIVCEAEREESILTRSERGIYISKIDNALSDDNIRKAMKAVIRN